MRKNLKSKVFLVAFATIIMSLFSSNSYSMENKSGYQLCSEAYLRNHGSLPSGYACMDATSNAMKPLLPIAPNYKHTTFRQVCKEVHVKPDKSDAPTIVCLSEPDDQ